jgi:hypothetical protein
MESPSTEIPNISKFIHVSAITLINFLIFLIWFTFFLTFILEWQPEYLSHDPKNPKANTRDVLTNKPLLPNIKKEYLRNSWGIDLYLIDTLFSMKRNQIGIGIPK